MTTRAAQDQDDDRSLLRRYARDGDAEAFAELVHRYVALVYGVCLRVTRSRADAEDVTQECLLELAKNAAKVHTSVGGYLHTVATRRSLMHCRSAGRRAQREATIVPADAEHDPASAAHITEVVDTALQELDEESRNLIIQRFLQGRSQQAIAAGLGVDQSTVSRKLTDAIEKMRKRLAGMGMMAGVAEVATTMEKLGGAPAPPGLASSAVKIGIAGAGAARSSGVAPLTYTMMIVFVVLAGALGYALHAREGTKIMTGPTTASSAGIHPDLKGTHLSGFGMKRDSVSVAFQAAAQALGKDADYERLYLLSGNAFAPAINTGETCRSWWHVQARMGTRNLPAMADSVGLSAERLAVPALPDTATEAQRAAVRKTAADLARQAMDSGAVVITEGGWDEAGAWVWSGVVTDIADDGTMRGAALRTAKSITVG